MSRRGSRRSSGRDRGRRPVNQRYSEDFDERGESESGHRSRRPPARARRPPRQGFFARLFGRGGELPRRGSRGGGFDWNAEEDGYDDHEEYEQEAPRRRASRKGGGKERLTLMDLCTPCSAVPRSFPPRPRAFSRAISSTVKRSCPG